jgi:hypothetical protein
LPIAHHQSSIIVKRHQATSDNRSNHHGEKPLKHGTVVQCLVYHHELEFELELELEQVKMKAKAKAKNKANL